MGAMIECDWCGAQSTPILNMTWWKLDREVKTLGDMGPWDFCSATCLGRWVDGRLEGV